MWMFESDDDFFLPSCTKTTHLHHPNISYPHVVILIDCCQWLCSMMKLCIHMTPNTVSICSVHIKQNDDKLINPNIGYR